MKTNYGLILMSAALLAFSAFAVSCQEKEQGGPNPGPKPEPETEPVTLSLTSSFASKTTLGELGSDGKYPVYWTDGDRICVNGVKSSVLSGTAPKTVRADFEVKGVSAPYHVVYPSIICDGISADGLASLNVPAAQAYCDTSFASLSAILYGSTEGTDTELKNACGVVRIPLVKGSEFGGKISTITLSSASDASPISGKFSLNTLTGEMLPLGENSGSTFLSLPAQGVDLSSEARYFYIAIPSGEYPEGFSILLDSPEGQMLCEWKEETAVPAGIVVTLPQIDFKPKSTKLIDGIDSWNEFAAAVNGGDYQRWIDEETGEATLVADISCGGDLTSITSLPEGFIFNGNGHRIDRGNASEPLFVLIDKGATVKNLTIGGTRNALSSTLDRGTGNLAAFNRGLIDNCTSSMTVSLENVQDNLVFAGLVTDNAGTIKDSRNTGDIILSVSSIVADHVVYGGGLCARGWRNLNNEADKYNGHFINCENKGNITLKRTAAGSWNMAKFAVGGIVGCINQGTSEGAHCEIEGCTNSGNITCWQDSKHETASNKGYTYCVGGIVGRCGIVHSTFYAVIGGATATAHEGYYVHIKDCTNTGTIDVAVYSNKAVVANMSCARLIYAGGIIGLMQSNWDDYSKIEGCTSKCILRPGNAGAASGNGGDASGGIAGALGYTDVENCTADVSFNVSLNTMVSSTSLGLEGGAVGVVCRDSNIKDCSVTMNLDPMGGTYIAGGFAGSVAQNTNIKEHVATSGYATMFLKGTNTFSGTINGVAVSASNVAGLGTKGKINGELTIK